MALLLVDPRAAARPRALVAESEPLACWAVARALEPLGFDVTVAATREEACGHLFAGGFDYVVMSCRLGDCDMSDVVGELLRFSTSSRVTLLCSEECGGACRRWAGRSLVLQRPFPLGDVLEGARAALAARSAASA